MGLKQLYIDIRTQLLSLVDGNSNPLIKFCQVWNNQVTYNNDGQHYNYPMPCVFIEMASPITIEQMGDGYQLYNIVIRLHIVHEFYNSIDGNGIEEQDLSIFDLKDAVYIGMQKYEPNGAVQFVRTSETQDYEHTNVYHMIQEYTTNYVDNTREEPVGFIDINDPPIVDTTLSFNINPTYLHIP